MFALPGYKSLTGRTERRISRVGRILRSGASACAALCIFTLALPAAGVSDVSNSSVRTYTGTIGTYPIRMSIERHAAQITGHYECVRTGARLGLEGAWSGDTVRMQELYHNRVRTATIVARPRENGGLEGTWTNKGTGQVLPFRVRSASGVAQPRAQTPHAAGRAGTPAVQPRGRNRPAQASGRKQPPRDNLAVPPRDIGGEILQAVRKGDTETARALLQDRPNLDPRDDQGRTALMLACTFRNGGSEETSFVSMDDRIDFVKFLLRRNVELDAKDRRGYTALMYAAASWGAGNPLIRLLLDAGADINARNNYQGTALMVATGKFGHVRTVQMLLDAGAKVNLRDKFAHTALWYARSHHATAAVRELESAGGEE